MSMENEDFEDLDFLLDTLEAAQETRSSLNATLEKIIEKELPNTHVQVKSRVKHSSSAKDKKQWKRENGKPDYSFKRMTDIIGVRLVCHFPNDLLKALEKLCEIINKGEICSSLHEDIIIYTNKSHMQYDINQEAKRIIEDKGLACVSKDSIKRYTSIHMVWTLPDGTKPKFVEVQMRTVFEDAWCEIQHATYKNSRKDRKEIDRDFSILNSFIQACVEFSDHIYYKSNPNLNMDPLGQSDERATHLLPHQDIWEKIRNLENTKCWDDAILAIDATMSNTNLTPEEEFAFKYRKGELLIKQEKLELAITQFKELEDEFPDKLIVPFMISDIYANIDRDRSIAHFRKLFKKIYDPKFAYPHDERNQEILRRVPLKLSSLLWKSEKLDDAIDVIRWAKELRGEKLPKTTISAYSNSEVYFKMEKLIDPEERGCNFTYEDLIEQFEREVIKDQPLDQMNLDALDTYGVLLLKSETKNELLPNIVKNIRMAIHPHKTKVAYEARREGKWVELPIDDYHLVQVHIREMEEACQVY